MQDIQEVITRQNILQNPNIQFAGFWIRILAHIIDFFVVAIPLSILEVIVLSILGNNVELAESIRDNSSYFYSAFWGIYFVSFHSSEWQATIGKKALGLIVVDEKGDRISFGRAVGRLFALYLSVIPLGLGIIMISWTKYKQSLHDKIAKTYVIKETSLQDQQIV